ncbi:Hypothetical Protein OBI_RACECAR_217 [Arthrobacter phage Racecar]|nr:hypothetical protein PBI_RACECAR_9 [Arthrobacter phage Racecar]QFG12694.1 hypothetical protein PBI_MIMI_9 [Arthrobacter phage Mimi]
MIYDAIAEALYKDWQTSDKELSTSWEDAPANLKRVFFRKAEIALEVIDTFKPVA